MKIADLKLDWLERLGKVLFILAALLGLPLGYAFGTATAYMESQKWFWAAVAVLTWYISLVLVAKTLLYIVKGQDFLRAGFGKKSYLLLVIPVVIYALVGGVFALIVEPQARENARKQAEAEYLVARAEIDRLEEDKVVCVEETREKFIQGWIRDCSLRRADVKSDYDFCVRYSLDSADSCLYKNNYEAIDCSDSAARNTFVPLSALSKASASCQDILTVYLKAKETTNAYEEQYRQ